MSRDPPRKVCLEGLPAGYCIHKKKPHLLPYAESGSPPILLPKALAEALEREWQSVEAELIKLTEDKENGLGSGNTSKAPKRSDEAPVRELPPRPRGTVPVFDWTVACAQLRALRKNPDNADRDLVRRDIDFLKVALEPGPWRKIALPRQWRQRLDALATEMPHFTPVIMFIAQRLALAQLARTPLRPPPILLLGSPGVGKTHATYRLAEILDAPVHRESFDNAEHAGALRGSSRHWGNTNVGALFKLIVLGQHAGPIVLLDEIDKASALGSSTGNPLDSLLTVLEPVSNARIVDQSVQFEFDASHVWYIATANDAAKIPAPVRSRFVEFVIQEPDIEARLTLAHSICASTLERLFPRRAVRERFAPLTNLQICRLAWLTPRQMRMTLEVAWGAAVLAQRWHIEDADLDALALQTPTESDASHAAGSAGAGRRSDDDGDPFAIVVFPR